jgi:ATP-dependent helicase/nuclease subunit B
MAPVGPVGFSEVLITLESVLLETAASPASQRPNAMEGEVFIGPIEAARGLSFASVFVSGVAKKMFPRKTIEEPILRDAARQQVGHELATNQKRA